MKRPTRFRRQGGVAIVTALLLTALAVTVVSSLFWQQQIQVRSMENQRLQLQTRWIVRGALDYARLILRQDGADGGGRTALNGVWATPLADTRLDQYIERERVENENFDASLSGRITDAQSRFNLENLANGREVSQANMRLFQRLLGLLHIDESLAQRSAELVARSHLTPPSDPGATPAPQRERSEVPSDGSEPAGISRLEDLLAVSGFDQQAIEKLRGYVIVLPAATPLNVNTAAPELLAALVDKLSLPEAQALATSRERKPFATPADFSNQLGERSISSGVAWGVNSAYFLVLSQVRLDRATLDSQALIERIAAESYRTTVLWIRDN